MSLTPQIDTSEISDSDLDNISGGTDPQATAGSYRHDGVDPKWLQPAREPRRTED